MARLEDLDPNSQPVLRKMDCPVFETDPWVTGPPLPGRRVAVVSTAGLHRATDRPFTFQEQWKESEDAGLKAFSRLLMIPRARLADSPYRK